MTAFRVFCASCVMMFFITSAHAADDEYHMSAEEVHTIQSLLFENGYMDAGLPNGKLGPQTREMIAAFQVDREWPETGYLTEEQYLEILAGGSPSDWAWGAVSASYDSKHFAVSNQTSGVAAYRAVEQSCRKHSSQPGPCMSLATWTDKESVGWIAAVLCKEVLNGKAFSAVSIISNESEGEAVEEAIGVAVDDGFSRSACQLLAVIASDGSHQ